MRFLSLIQFSFYLFFFISLFFAFIFLSPTLGGTEHADKIYIHLKPRQTDRRIKYGNQNDFKLVFIHHSYLFIFIFCSLLLLLLLLSYLICLCYSAAFCNELIVLMVLKLVRFMIWIFSFLFGWFITFK